MTSFPGDLFAGGVVYTRRGSFRTLADEWPLCAGALLPRISRLAARPRLANEEIAAPGRGSFAYINRSMAASILTRELRGPPLSGVIYAAQPRDRLRKALPIYGSPENSSRRGDSPAARDTRRVPRPRALRDGGPAREFERIALSWRREHRCHASALMSRCLNE